MNRKLPQARHAAAVFVMLLQAALCGAQSSKAFVNRTEHNGLKISCVLPNDQQMRNVGSKIDGSGMCVFTSIEHAARFQGLEEMRGFRDWAAANYRGGGWPEKVDQLLGAWWKAKGLQPIPYVQYEGKAPEDLMKVIDRTGRCACITYGYSERYGTRIAHMVNCVLYADGAGVVLDNNFVGNDKLEWMDRAELIRRMRLDMRGQQGPAWVFCWLTPGNPPPAKKKVQP